MPSLCFACLALLSLLLPQKVTSAPFPEGAARTECRGRYFWIWLDKATLGQNSWHYRVFNELGQLIPVTEQVASQCGFTSTTDLYGNPEIRVSFLGCLVQDSFDQEFSLKLQVEIISPANMTVAYDVSMTCPLDVPWSPREIVCEENYMEVSVRRAVPGIVSEALNDDWIGAWPVAQRAVNQVWQIVFHFQNGSRQNMTATEAHALGYGVRTTPSRVLFRTPYSMPQTEISKVQGLEMEVARATVFYKQAWMILIVDTAVACPINPPVFTASTLSWVTPRIMPSLVKFPDLYRDEVIEMGLDGRVINAATIVRNGYTFLTDANFITISVPIGASGGLTESDVVDNSYGTRYSIKLLLDRRWQGDQSDHTRHRSLKAIRTTFIPHRPVLINNTVPERRYFDVTLGSFLPDVALVTVTIGGKPLTPEEIESRGSTLSEVPYPNGTRAFTLTVPFDDPLVPQEYLYGNIRRYTLPLVFTLNLVPKNKPFIYPAVVECEVPDVVLPTVEGFCEPERISLVLAHGNLDLYWVPYVGDLQLTVELAASQNYTVQDDGRHFYLSVPLLAAGLAYEDLSLRGLTARLDFNLRDNKTLATIMTFPVSCVFPTGKLLVCLPNDTMAATVLSVDTRPPLDPRRTHLRDESCRPVAANESGALFSFSINTCGTTRKFEGNYLVYENEVTFKRQLIPETNPVITRDSQYRLTLRCRYPLNETLRVWAQRLLGDVVTPAPYALGSRDAIYQPAAEMPPLAYRQGRSMDGRASFVMESRILAGAAQPVQFWLPVLGISVFGVAVLVGVIA